MSAHKPTENLCVSQMSAVFLDEHHAQHRCSPTCYTEASLVVPLMPDQLLIADQLERITAHAGGFLYAQEVVPGSAADLAGICAGDVFCKFGHLTQANFENLESTAAFVRNHPDVVVHVTVYRRAKLIPRQCVVFQKLSFAMTPVRMSSGGGVLGVVLRHLSS